jgi:hypothetical protein
MFIMRLWRGGTRRLNVGDNRAISKSSLDE